MIRLVAILLLLAAPALAQNAAPVPVARLPDPQVDDAAAPSAFVTAARSAIAAGRTGEAMEAIERAESRVLMRSVRPSLARTPSDQAVVRLLAAARTALGQGDRAAALARLAEAQSDPALDATEE